MTESHASTAIQYARLLLAVNGVAWIGITVATASLFWPRAEGAAPLILLLALMVVNAGVLLGLAVRLGSTGARMWIFAMAWVALNFVLSFTDDVGLPDVLSGALNLVTFAVLVTAWREYRRAG